MIGHEAGYYEYGSNKLVIDNSYSFTPGTSSLIYGEFENSILKLNAKVNIRDVLNLKPRATAPLSPNQGDMYFDSGTSKLMVYDGTTWQACW